MEDEELVKRAMVAALIVLTGGPHVAVEVCCNPAWFGAAEDRVEVVSPGTKVLHPGTGQDVSRFAGPPEGPSTQVPEPQESTAT